MSNTALTFFDDDFMGHAWDKKTDVGPITPLPKPFTQSVIRHAKNPLGNLLTPLMSGSSFW